MGYFHNPRIVRDGLVLYLDAANKRSYSGSGTEWKDLSGNNYSGSLNNSPTYTTDNFGSMIFDGTNDYLISNLSKNQFSTQITISITFKMIDIINVRGLLQFSNSLFDAFPWILLRTASANTISWYLNGTYRTYQTIPLNGWVSITLTYDGTVWKTYKNGIYEAEYIGPVGTYSGNNYYIGVGYNGYTNIEVSNSLVYNKALSAAEVLQNYEATKGRFGL